MVPVLELLFISGWEPFFFIICPNLVDDGAVSINPGLQLGQCLFGIKDSRGQEAADWERGVAYKVDTTYSILKLHYL